MKHLDSSIMRSVQLAIGIFSVLTIYGCGGGGGSSNDNAPITRTVSSITPDRLSYGRLSTFTVIGAGLSSGVTFTTGGCDSLAVVAGGSDSQQTFTCIPNTSLAVQVAALSSGSEIFSKTLAVPKPQVTMITSMGTVVVELEPTIVPVTVNNFLAYVKSAYYNGTLFHRIIPSFVIQGGGFVGVGTNTLNQAPGLGSAIVLESNRGLNNLRGTISMARQTAPDTAIAQFFFNIADNPSLNYSSAALPGYAVFGHVVSGLEILDTMSAVSTRTVGPFANVPVTDVMLTSITQTL